jgi:hypothetical protein
MPKVSKGYMATLTKTKKDLPILWYKYIRNRLLKLDYNFIKITCGNTGTGKTTINLIDMFMINPKRFSAERVAMSPAEYMDARKDCKKGDVVVWGEGGVGMDARLWHRLSQIYITQALSVEREQNVCTLFDTPDPSLLDSRTRVVTDCFSETKRYSNDYSTEYLYRLVRDRKKGIFYYPWYSHIYNGKRYDMPKRRTNKTLWTAIKRRKPIEVKEIEKKISEYKAKVMEKGRREAKLFEQERWAEEEGLTTYDYANLVAENPNEFMTTKGRIDWHLIKAKYPQLSRDRAMMVQRLVKKERQKKHAHNVVDDNKQNIGKKKAKSKKKVKDLT